MESEVKNNRNIDIYIESSTLHDDELSSCHEIFASTRSDNMIDSTSNSSNSKAQNCAGGFSFNLKTDNRFILWKIIGNKLELIENSLTHKLSGNFKRIHFKDAMIIPKIHIYKHLESENNNGSFSIHILIATTSKLYRLIFKFNKNEHLSNSIFSQMSSMTFSNIDANNSYQINLNQVESTDIFVNQRGEAFFAFVLPNNSICCVQMPSHNRSSNVNQNIPTKFEINQPNIVKRLWSGITRTVQDSSTFGFVSFKFFSLNDNLYFVCLCRDFKLKLWCIKSNQCIYVEELNKFFKSDMGIMWNESKIDAISLNDHCILTVVFSTTDQFKLCNLNVSISNNNDVTINEVSKRTLAKTGELISIQCTNFNTWIMYKNDREQVEIMSVTIHENNRDQKNTPSEIQIINFNKNDKPTLGQFGMMNESNEQIGHDDDDNEQFNEDFDDDEKINEQILSEMDLKELYLKKIFEPFRYSKHNIIKSLGILGSVNSSDNCVNAQLNQDEIKQKLIKSIETAVQSHPNYSNISEDEFLGLNMKLWSKYYTMLNQYDFDSRLPLGFYIEPNNESIILLIRKNSFSTFGRADLSQFYLNAPIESIKSFLFNRLKKDQDESELNDVIYLILTLRCIDYNLRMHSNFNFSSLSKELDFASCYQYINEMTDYLTLSQKDFFGKFSPILEKINNLDGLDRIMSKFFDLFNVNNKLQEQLKCGYKMTDEAENEETDMETDHNSNSLRISSEFTINCIISSFRNLIQKRFDLFRNLSILVNIINKYFTKIYISSGTANTINQKFFELSINNMASYHFLKWLCDIYPYAQQQENIIKHLRRTSNILEDFKCDQINFKKGNELIIKLFLISTRQFSIQTDSTYLEITNYSQLNEYFTSRVLKFIWPINLQDNMVLIKYLLFNIQYIHLVNYCIGTKWISHSKNLRSFIMGHCCLFLNNIDQSINFFLRASYNLEKDVYLKKLMRLGSRSLQNSKYHSSDSFKNGQQNEFKNSRRSIIINKNSTINNSSLAIGNNNDDIDLIETNDNAILLEFYTKIIHYYDLNGNLEAAIELIQNALLQSQFDSKSKSKLYCVLFKSYMDLEYFEKAYMSMMSNSDLEWKKICLKNFISELCNQNKMDVLVSFDYGELLNEVFNILMSRAKASDLRNNDFYKVLFTLYIKIKDYRKAAYCMYECYLRLRREVMGINSLKRQEKCLLACMNMLKLVEKKMSWINITDLGELCFDEFQNQNNSSKLKIIDQEEINKSYLIVNSTLKIFAGNQSHITGQHSTEELINLLTKNGYYDEALNICLNNKASSQSLLVNVLISLVDRCCNANVTETSDDKLTDDVLVEIELIKRNDCFEQSQSPYENPYSFKWKLLETYLDKLNESLFYKHVCQRILMLGFEIPATIQYKFKKLNPQNLLAIYLNYGLWSEALDLIKESIDIAANSKDPLNLNKQSDTVIPFSLIDSLSKYCQSQFNKEANFGELKKIVLNRKQKY